MFPSGRMCTEIEAVWFLYFQSPDKAFTRVSGKWDLFDKFHRNDNQGNMSKCIQYQLYKINMNFINIYFIGGLYHTLEYFLQNAIGQL